MKNVSLEHMDVKHLTKVTVGGVVIYFSYAEVIAFQHGETLVLSENLWGRTTGRHLNMVSRTAERLPREEFLEQLSDIIA